MVYGFQQTHRWLKAGVFEAIVHDLRQLLRLAVGRERQPSAAIFDSRTCNRHPNLERVPSMTERNEDAAAKPISPLILWESAGFDCHAS
jgi:hypothetical protein